MPLKPILTVAIKLSTSIASFCCVSAHHHHDRRIRRSSSTYCARTSPTCGQGSLRGTRTSWCVYRRRVSSVTDSWSAVDSLFLSSINRLYMFLVRYSIHRFNLFDYTDVSIGRSKRAHHGGGCLAAVVSNRNTPKLMTLAPRIVCSSVRCAVLTQAAIMAPTTTPLPRSRRVPRYRRETSHWRRLERTCSSPRMFQGSSKPWTGGVYPSSATRYWRRNGAVHYETPYNGLVLKTDCVPYLRRPRKYRPSLSPPLMFWRETAVAPEII